MKAPTQDKDKTPCTCETDSSHSCFNPTDFHGVDEYFPWTQPFQGEITSRLILVSVGQ